VAAKHSHKQLSENEQRVISKRVSTRNGIGAAHSAESLSRDNSLERYGTARKKRRRKKIIRGTLITLLCVLLSGVIAIGAYVFDINSRLTSGIDASLRAVLSESSFDEPFYILLLGVDKDQGRTESADYGEDDSAYRTDTIILARIDPVEKKVTLISIPRDTYVDMGDYGMQKINSAYSYGGAAYTVQVVEELAGVDISHYAEVDMDGFASIVDAVGGVDVDLPVAVYDPDYTGLDLPAGEQHLDGTTAALLARCRHGYDSYGSGDYYRAANQRMLIGEVVKKILSSDAATMSSTISTAANYITTDLSVSDIIGLATQFSGFDVDEDLYSGQCPTTSQYIDNLWVELVNKSEWEKMMDRVDSGLPPYSDSSQDVTAGVAGSLGVTTSGSDSSSSDTVEADYSGAVLVLNGAGVSGLASSTAEKISDNGFSTRADNASTTTDTTVIYYNGEGGESKAVAVNEILGGSYTYQANDGTYDTSVDVVVVLGSDYAATVS
jgi:LCP family protein required for cell wall assembly